MKRTFLLLIAVVCLVSIGCPDRSYMREKPNYDQMKDNSLSEEEFLKQQGKN